MVSRTPVILPPLSSLSDCMKIGLWSETESQSGLDRADKVDRSPKLMSINVRVANVAVCGEKEPQLQVVGDPERLRANGVTLDQLTQAVRDATAVGAWRIVDTPISVWQFAMFRLSITLSN